MELIRAIRNVRAENQVAPGKTITAIVHASPEKQQLVTDSEEYLKTLGKISELTVAGLEADKPEKVVTAIAAGIEIYLPLADLVDLEQEIQRLQGELEKTQQEISRSQGKLANEGFVNKAPEAVVDKERAKLAALLEQEERIRARLAELQE